MAKNKSKPKRKYKPARRASATGYGILDALLASPDQPIPLETQNFYATRILSALDDLAQSEMPSVRSWNLLGDITNIMQTGIDDGLCHDESALIADAVNALVAVSKRHDAGESMRLTGGEIHPIRALVTDFLEIMAIIPHRQMVQLHRRTEARIKLQIQDKTNEIIFVK